MIKNVLRRGADFTFRFCQLIKVVLRHNDVKSRRSINQITYF